MTNRALIFCFALIFLFGACMGNIPGTTIQGSGRISSEDRSLQGVHAVTLATIGDLTITLGDSESIRIEAEDNLLPYLETPVSGGTLTIQERPQTNLQPSRPIRYQLTVKNLDSLSVTSSGNIEAPSLQATRFTASISSSGNIHIAGLVAEQITVRISSSGSLEISEGQVGGQQIDISSSGSYTAGEVRSQNADVNITSSGRATIWVTERLNADLSSSGDVDFYGQPAITQNMTSSGKVVSLGNK